MCNILQDPRWGIGRLNGSVEYPPESSAPYLPDRTFPEFPGLPPASEANPVFAAVRQALMGAGLDVHRFETPDWNPLGDLVKPGGLIVVKPNWVLHQNQGSGGMDCMITHPAVLRAVLEYVFLARPARVVLGDAPVQGCDFEQLLDHGGLRTVIDDFVRRGLPLLVKDFRRTILRINDGLPEADEELRPESDYALVDLGSDSMLEPISADWRKFRVTVYDPRKMWRHHRPGRHRYLIANEVLEADLVVNVPKLKVHKKAGITCCLKNLVGINGNKEFLPHHRKGGSASGGGDNYAGRKWELGLAEHVLDIANCLRRFPRLHNLGFRIAYRLVGRARNRSRTSQVDGSWHGNDTVWRMCLDLNRVLLYAGRDGVMREEIQREEISIVDAVLAGQGEGPLAPDPLETGAVIVARNPAVGDYIGAQVLGLDPAKIPLLHHACDDMRWRICRKPPDAPAFTPSFPKARPPGGWAGHIES